MKAQIKKIYDCYLGVYVILIYDLKDCLRTSKRKILKKYSKHNYPTSVDFQFTLVA